MEVNNTMVNIGDPNKNETTYSNKYNERKDNSDYSMQRSKRAIKLKSKASNFKLSCKNDPNKKFELNTEELTIHILSCDDCLKELLLNQARQEKLERDLLNDKKERKLYHKKNKKFDINNSMSANPEKLNNLEDEENKSYSDSGNDDEGNNLEVSMYPEQKKNKKNGKRKKVRRKESPDDDENEESDEDEKDNDLLAQTMLNAKDVEKTKKKNKKNKDREKISESEGEETSNDDNNFEDYFINSKKKINEKKKNKKNKKKTKNDEDENDDGDDYFNI